MIIEFHMFKIGIEIWDEFLLSIVNERSVIQMFLLFFFYFVFLVKFYTRGEWDHVFGIDFI